MISIILRIPRVLGTLLKWSGHPPLNMVMQEPCFRWPNTPFDTSGEWLFVVCRHSLPGNVFPSNGDEYQYFRQHMGRDCLRRGLKRVKGKKYKYV